MNWYRQTAPIRQKLFVTFAIMTGLIVTATIGVGLGTLYGGLLVGLAIGATFAVATAMIGAWFRTAIADPYVATVVRMEGLAAGDLSTPIEYTTNGDCVGRITKAMFTFRDAAVAQIDRAAQQKIVVETVSTHLSDLSSGDLTASIKVDFPAEYAALKTNFNEALSNLRDLIGAVSESAATIRTGSGEIAQASEDLARRTESNAASLEETAASVTQMDGRLKASAVAASRTVERADQAIATVGGGRSVADEAVQAMGRVSDSAKGIDSVIEGLDKIAFQTRVLAMNAAVEAGRAGDAGRGFAVVADLVSALAMRAEEEAKRARDQLTVTQTDIVTAVEAVRKVDGALSDISGDVGQVHELLATMAADNQAQSAAITQISAAIGTMDQSTQQNAAMVEQTSAAARNLASEVGGLTDQAARFNTGQSAARTRVQRAFGGGETAPAYASPVKPLPAAAIPALVRSDDDWNAF
jgi:methyl-accepting chemotaxis protein